MGFITASTTCDSDVIQKRKVKLFPPRRVVNIATRFTQLRTARACIHQECPFFQMFLFTYNHPRMAGPSDKAEAMNRIKSILREANFSAPGSAFPFSKEYGSWETDLVRNQAGRRAIIHFE